MPKEPCGNRIKAIRSALVALPVLRRHRRPRASKRARLVSKECCHDMDCAPVESMSDLCRRMEAIANYRRVEARQSHLPMNFPLRESKDSRMHVCMRHTIQETWT